MKTQLTEFYTYLSEQKALKKSVNQEDIINNFIKLHEIKDDVAVDISPQIINKVCNVLSISPEQIKQKVRKREIVEARQITMWMLKKYTKLSLPQIGKLFESGDHVFDHATVLHAIKTVDNLKSTNKDFRNKFKEVEKQIEMIK